jgi:hypothetical protein
VRAGGQVVLQLPYGRVRPTQIPHLRANRFGKVGITLQSFEKTGAPPDGSATFARHRHLGVPFPTQRPAAWRRRAIGVATTISIAQEPPQGRLKMTSIFTPDVLLGLPSGGLTSENTTCQK